MGSAAGPQGAGGAAPLGRAKADEGARRGRGAGGFRWLSRFRRRRRPRTTTLLPAGPRAPLREGGPMRSRLFPSARLRRGGAGRRRSPESRRQRRDPELRRGLSPSSFANDAWMTAANNSGGLGMTPRAGWGAGRVGRSGAGAVDPGQYRQWRWSRERIRTPAAALPWPSRACMMTPIISKVRQSLGRVHGGVVLPGAWRKRAAISLWSRAYPSVSAASSLCRMCHLKCRVARSFPSSVPTVQARPPPEHDLGLLQARHRPRRARRPGHHRRRSRATSRPSASPAPSRTSRCSAG